MAKQKNDGVAAFKPDLTRAESRALAQAIDSGWVGSGVYVRLFESRLASALGSGRAVAVTSGTAALHVVMNALGVEGGEVITTPLTSPATNHAILYNRAVPVFCDVDPDTGTIDPALAARLVTRRTKAIVAVHFNGHPCDMDPLLALARARGLPLIEDAAAALPFDGHHRGRRLGTMGDAGCFSFSRKNFTTLDGGAVFCANAKLASRVTRLRNLGQRDSKRPEDRGPDLDELGFPYRMNDLAAAMGLSQLDRWEATLARLRTLDATYRRALEESPKLSAPGEKPGTARSLSSFPVRIRAGKDRLRAFLAARGVRTDDWLRPNHLLPLYRPYRRRLPAAECLAEELLYLPFYPGLTDAEAAKVAEALRAFRR